MARLAAIVLILSISMPETILAGIVFEAGEIDSSRVKPGAFVEVIYGKGERDEVSGTWEKLATARGYIQAIDSKTLIIGERFWKKEIALECVQKLTIFNADREKDKLRKPRASLLVRTKNRHGIRLLFETGYFTGVRTEFLDLYFGGSKGEKGLPWSISLYLGDERHWRLALRGTYRKVQIFARYTDAELAERFPLAPRRESPRHRDGITYRLVSVLLAYQRAVYRSLRTVVLVDLAGGISYKTSYFNNGGDQVDSPTNFPCGSAGVAFLLPIHSRVSLQASVRKDFLVAYFPDPFISGMSVTIGPLLEF